MMSPAGLGAALIERLGDVYLIGCGNMGGAMLRRWIDAGLPPDNVTVVDPGTPTLPAGVSLINKVDDRGMAARGSIDTLILAVKPQQLDDAIGSIGASTPRLVISILAGVEEAVIARGVTAGAVVRAMPNLPVGIGKGVVALFSSHGRPEAWRADDAAALMAPLGLVEWIDDEAKFDAVTALSGCGPGFVFRFVEALAAAGNALGLDRAQALRLARATVEGAATMAAVAPETPSVLADRVASPGGSTREGLNVLDRDDALVRLMTATLEAAAARNREMATAARSGSA